MQDQQFIQYLLYNKQLPYKLESQKTLILYCCVATFKVLNAEFHTKPILEFLQ